MQTLAQDVVHGLVAGSSSATAQIKSAKARGSYDHVASSYEGSSGPQCLIIAGRRGGPTFSVQGTSII